MFLTMMKRTIGFLMIGHLLLMTGMLSGAWGDEWQIAAARTIKQWVQPYAMLDEQLCSDQRFDLCTALTRFYAYRQYAPAWVDRWGVLPAGKLILNTLGRAGDQGLLSADYQSPWLDHLLDGSTVVPVASGADFIERRVRHDLVMTEMILRYAYDQTLGRIDPVMLAYEEKPQPAPPRDLALELAASLASGRLKFFLAQLKPPHKAFRALEKSLHHYQMIRAAGGWRTIDEGADLEQGDCGPRVTQLRYRLGISEDIHFASELKGNCFDDPLVAAVKRFQRRNGLSTDGRVGPKTLAALNVPVEQRLRQIQLNLERWRWMPEALGSTYVLVNIPGFQLKVVQEGQIVKTLRAIVGRPDRPTPVLSSKMTYLEINPYWYVPVKIAREDLLPKIKEDPFYLVRQDFRVFDGWDENAREIDPLSVDWSSLGEAHFPYRLRQEPVANNALGRVKFMFPNDLSVYIHDTPSKSLFQKPSRDFSSGCVRVENPLDLMAFLLERQNWDQERLSKAVASHRRQVVVLQEPVPVYLVYLTAWVDKEGRINFRDDIYGQDRQLLSALAQNSVDRQGAGSILFHPNYVVQTQQNSLPNL